MNSPKLHTLSKHAIDAIEQHIQQEKLPDNFLQTVHEFYWPIVLDVIQSIENNKTTSIKTPYFLGIQGTQGSGKSTFASFIKLILEQQFDKNCLVLSLDDFYLTKEERQTLSQDIHPLLATRGVPGTHDISLLKDTLEHINGLEPEQIVSVVTFNKAQDDRAATQNWQVIAEPQDVVILEGWCVGVSAQNDSQLIEPINDLETEEDPDGLWRSYVNEQIGEHYQSIYDAFDGFVMLAAPSFECVYEWRTKQEQKLIDKLTAAGKPLHDTMNAAQIKRFISHYQRLTEHGLQTLPAKANWLLRLHPSHAITDLIRNA